MYIAGRDFSTGTTVSAVGHVVLIVWLLTGWGLTHEPLPFDVTEVTVVSGEEYAQLVAATTPQPATEIGVAPQAPAPNAAPLAPEIPPAETPPPAPEPQPDAPAAEAPPPAPPEPAPPPAEVADQVTEPIAPEPTAPEVSVRPAPRPAPRVAPEAVAPPPPDIDVAPQVTEAATPEAEAPEIVPEPAEAAAPEEAATEIVTEAEPPSGAVETSLRPQTRPNRPAPQPAPAPSEPPADEAAAEPAAEPAAQPSTESVEDDIAAALAAAAAEPPIPAPAANPGPPMTGAEQDAFRIAVSGCWSVDVGSEAARVTLTVSFELGRDGMVIGAVRFLSGTGGSQAAIDAAFDAARRAVLRCQSATGYRLPDDKYEQWREVEMTFDPSGMRLR